VVPKTNNFVAQAPQILRSFGILLFAMLPSIGLDNQLSLDADKVGNIWAERQLAAEFTVSYLPRPQVLP
jgi:hypothetical protein